MSIQTSDVIKQLKDTIIAIPDFPKKGIIFRDLTPILSHPDVYANVVDEINRATKDWNYDVIVSPESRGFWFGIPLAFKTKKMFIPARKKGKLPRPTISQDFTLEYATATIEIHKGDLPKGSRVLIVDDLIATSGTIEAITQLVAKAEAKVVGIYCVVGLKALDGKHKLEQKLNIPCKTLLDY